MFVIVTVFAALVTPTASLPKAKTGAENVTGARPVPERGTVCGEFVAVSVIVIAPEMAPVTVGLNVSFMVQVPPLLSVPVHVFVAAAKSPLDAIDMVVDSVPVFFTVIAFCALVDPTAVEVNTSLAGVIVITTGSVPVPVSFTVCGEFVALSVTVNEPVRVPAVRGVNVTVTVQLAAAFSVVGQLFVCAKSPVAAETVSGVDTFPVFFTMTALPALVVFMVCAANVSLAGVVVTVTTAATPVPVRETVCGAPTAVSLIVGWPGRLPAVVGSNVTEIVQCAFAARLVPHGVVPPATAE